MYVKRDLEDEVMKYLAVPEILAVVGSRQCGKTSMVTHIIEQQAKKGKKTVSISFDNRKDLELFEKDPDLFAERYIKNYDIIFIDEIQYSTQGGKTLKYLYDRYKPKIIISGSSAIDLSVQSVKYLVGRVITFTLQPFSFNEYLRSNAPELETALEKEISAPALEEINEFLKKYLLYGGYPRVALEKDEEKKRKLLEGIYSTYVLREIKEVLALSDDEKVNLLIKALSLQIGNLVNLQELQQITGANYHENKKYLSTLEKTFIIKLVKPFYTNKRTELLKNPKIYFIDFGFRNVAIDNFTKERTDIGALYENFVCTELIKNNKTPKFWRTKSGAEVDFILEPNTPIEVKTTSTVLSKSVHSYIERYSPEKFYVLSLKKQSRENKDNTLIIYDLLVRAAKI